MDDCVEDDNKQSNQGFFAVIPSFVLDDMRLSDFDKILYSYISSLTKKQGHCWASNKYLANLTKRSESTIKRSINSLSKFGYVVRDITLEGGNSRILFINHMGSNLNPSSPMTPPQVNSEPRGRVNNDLPPRSIVNPPYMINKVISKENINKNIYRKNLFLDYVYLSKEEYDKLIDRFGKEMVSAQISSLNNYIGSKGVKYKSHYHTILNWVNRSGLPEKKEKVVARKDPEYNSSIYQAADVLKKMNEWKKECN